MKRLINDHAIYDHSRKSAGFHNSGSLTPQTTSVWCVAAMRPFVKLLLTKQVVKLTTCYVCFSVISERERSLTFTFAMLSLVRLSYVCLSVCLFVTLVHPSQPVESFGNVSTPSFGTIAFHWHPRKILRRSSQRKPSVGEVKRKSVVLGDTNALMPR